jgi:hypothetical protein
LAGEEDEAMEKEDEDGSEPGLVCWRTAVAMYA